MQDAAANHGQKIMIKSMLCIYYITCLLLQLHLQTGDMFIAILKYQRVVDSQDIFRTTLFRIKDHPQRYVALCTAYLYMKLMPSNVSNTYFDFM